MTDEQLMQQALDALCVVFPGRLNMDEWVQNTELRAALRKRLAQPITSGQEPVAWAITYDGKTPYSLFHCLFESVVDAEINRVGGTASKMALYTHPAPEQQPLSDDQIFTACENVLCVYPNAQTTLDIARAIEAMLSTKE